MPTTEDWADIASGFRHKWQFPNCLGAVDGKHVAITAPAKSGSFFYNYKVHHLWFMHVLSAQTFDKQALWNYTPKLKILLLQPVITVCCSVFYLKNNKCLNDV